jgi:hypothetical protein
VAPDSLAITCRRIAEHFAECHACGLAGGEQADPDDLCATGRELLRSREGAEKSLILERVNGYESRQAIPGDSECG